MLFMIISAVIVIGAVLLFLLLIQKVLEWCQQESIIQNKWKRRGAYGVFIGICAVTGVVLLVIVFFSLLSLAMMEEANEHSKRVNLNETGDTIPMYAGDTWDVDGKASVTLKEITLLSGEDDTRYYEVCFDYENISINDSSIKGYKTNGEPIENEMALSVYVDAADKDLDNTVGWLSSNDEDYYYAKPGETVTDNRFRFVLESEDAEESKYVRISFTIYTTDEYEFYRQDFVQEIQK